MIYARLRHIVERMHGKGERKTAPERRRYFICTSSHSCDLCVFCDAERDDGGEMMEMVIRSVLFTTHEGLLAKLHDIQYVLDMMWILTTPECEHVGMSVEIVAVLLLPLIC